MPLSEEAKSLIKDEVAALSTAQRDTLTEIEIAKYKAKEDIDGLMDEYKKTLHELNTYKWALRTVFVLLLGGSILGLAKFQDYIDGRIANRFERMDSLYYGVTLANSSQWREALNQLDILWSDFKAPGFKPTEQYRSFYYVNLLWVLSNTEDILPNGSWVGQAQWDRLNADPDFIHDFMTNNKWDYNDGVSGFLAICTLKYVKSNDALHTARNYYQRAYNSTEVNIKKADHLIGLAMLDIVEKKETDAMQKIQSASELNPSQYKVENLKLNKEAFLGSPGFKLFDDVARRIHGSTFKESYEKVIDNLPVKK